MVRIGLMSNGDWLPNRRALLAGLGAAALGAGADRSAFAAAATSVPLWAKPGTLALRPGQAETPIWSLEAPSRPPRFRRGSSVEIALQNGLDRPVAVDWHGLDGIPSAEPLLGQVPLAPGAKASFTASLRHAGTLFGDLRLLADGRGPLSRALPLIVDENQPPTVDRDEVFLIEDFRLRADGTAIGPGSDPRDATPVYTVNGLISPDIAVHSNQRLRLRLINGCQRQVVAAKIEGADVRVMAMDGQPAEPFFARGGAIVLAPGNRTDAFIDVTAQPGTTSAILLHDGKEARPIARLVTSNEPPARPAPLPSAPPLPSNDLPERLELKGAQRFDLVLNGAEWIAPASFSATAAPAFRVKANRVVALALANRAQTATTFHLHGHHFRLLDRLDDGWKPYWLDTLAVEPGQTERIAFHAEYAGRYLLESTATDWTAPKLLRWYSVE
jgi:FtsP/CotA-like multicopper oxidase with cupredoxin domain